VFLRHGKSSDEDLLRRGNEPRETWVGFAQDFAELA
jgi:hypothetical protein